MPQRQHWPERLWLVRHGQSQGNVARDAAHEAGLSVIDLDLRDVDVPLSDLGHRQAEATGHWFAAAFHLGQVTGHRPWDAQARGAEAQAWQKAGKPDRAALATVQQALATQDPWIRLLELQSMPLVIGQ